MKTTWLLTFVVLMSASAMPWALAQDNTVGIGTQGLPTSISEGSYGTAFYGPGLTGPGSYGSGTYGSVLSMQESGRRPIRRALLLTFRWAVLPPVPPRRRAGDLDEH
jgi:hypothetical protein